MKKLIAQGAESKLFKKGGSIVKQRSGKKYRIKELDEKLRKFRTKREAKVLEKLEGMRFASPKLLDTDRKEMLEMEEVKGKLLKDVLHREDYKKICRDIGGKIAGLHNHHIIHGDLTTSNMILNREVYFIDFGLSFFSHKIEDMAVDMHLLKEALESKHHSIWDGCYNAALEGYREKGKYAEEVLKRLKVVEKRGRYKGKK